MEGEFIKGAVFAGSKFCKKGKPHCLEEAMNAQIIPLSPKQPGLEFQANWNRSLSSSKFK